MDKTRFEEALASGRPIVIDGGLATQCEAAGYDLSNHLWSASLLQTEPQAIVDVHRAYLDAGAEIIIAAGYQASREGFAEIGLSDEQADELILKSVDLAEQARREYLADNPDVRYPLVAAGVGPYAAALHDGSEYTGDYGATAGELRKFHAGRLALFDASDADLLACETIPSIIEAQVLAELLRDVCSPAWVSFCCKDAEHLSDGTPVAEAASLFRGHPRALAVGVNCTAPEHMLPLIDRVHAAAPDRFIVVYPNSGEVFGLMDKTWKGAATQMNWGKAAIAWHAAGATLIGGCCRMGPADIRAMATSF